MRISGRWKLICNCREHGSLHIFCLQAYHKSEEDKEGCNISIGYIQARAFESFAQLPLKDVAVTVTDKSGRLIGMMLTDRSGLTGQIQVTVPEKADSLTPGSTQPFTLVDLSAHLNGYELIRARDLQLFADTVTYQELEMTPLPELPAQWSQSESFVTPPQNL